VHEGGLRVHTSLNLEMQRIANQAVLSGVASYERRHGWKDRLQNIGKSRVAVDSYQHPDWEDEPQPGDYVHALVKEVSAQQAAVTFGTYRALLSANDVAWTAKKLQSILKTGDVCYVKILSLGPGKVAKVALEQDSGVQGALIAIDNATGEIKAMVGGRDFNDSKFNRATQALRQVGSSFKPYVYTAAIDQGASPDDTVLDAPITFQTASGPYTPHNYEERYEGTISLRRALAQSLNIPALRLADRLTIKSVIDYAHRFGVSSAIPAYLPVALGSAEITLLEQTSAYSVFPNDGVRIVPRYITKVTDYEGRVLEEDFPDVKDVISSRTARIMTSMLEDVIQHGTGGAAASLKLPLAGKTGTTNDFTDAWFVGFSPSITCGVWVGYDEKKSLGAKETGARVALPIWMEFMKSAAAGKDPGEFQAPLLVPAAPGSLKVDTPDNAPAKDEAQ
jgi:penicillin-binding protein 1A